MAAIWVLVVGSCLLTPAAAKEPYEVHAVSSRPDEVSGGEVLVELEAPNRHSWTAWLNGEEVTRSFQRVGGSGRWRALLTGLEPGKNRLFISVRGQTEAKLDLLNHPLSGPIFSGPHQMPFICQTEANGLGPALDADCSARTIVQYYYKSTQPLQPTDSQQSKPSPGQLATGFKSYDLSAPRPSDIAQTATSEGRLVSYIVRRELGTINRAVYDIQFLHEPGQPLPTRERDDPPGECRQLYPPHGNPRLAAGAPLSNDILKCALKPVDAADYTQPLTNEQLKRLEAVFAQGVCDYRRPASRGSL